MKLALTDLDREVYENLSLTVACHPSETLERMMVRVLAYSLNVCDGLELCKSLSDTEEADLWRIRSTVRFRCGSMSASQQSSVLKRCRASRRMSAFTASILNRRPGGNCRHRTSPNYRSVSSASIGRACRRSRKPSSAQWSSR